MIDPDDVPTPKESGTFQIATASAEGLLKRIPKAVTALRETATRRAGANPLYRDPISAVACAFTASELERAAEDLRLLLPHLADDRKRPALLPDLWEIRRRCESILGGMGPGF